MIQKLLIGFFFLLAAFSSTAQNQRVVDSLLTVIDSTRSDTIKWYSLQQLSQIHMDAGKLDKAMEYALQLKEFLEKSKLQMQLGKPYDIMGQINERRGEYAAAIEYYGLAIRVRKENGFRRSLAGSYHNIGYAYLALNNFPEAIKYFELAREINLEVGNKKWLDYNHCALGNAYRHSGMYESAIESYSAALKLQTEADNKLRILGTLGPIGYCYDKLGNYPSALEIYYRGLRIAEEMGNKLEIAKMNIDIAWILHRGLGEHERALEMYLNALSVSQEMRDSFCLVRCYDGIGSMLTALGRYEEALESYLTEIFIYEECIKNDNTFISKNGSPAIAYGNLAICYNKMGKRHEAIHYHYKSMEYGGIHEIANAHLNIGVVFGMSAMWDSAYNHTIKALEMASEISELDIIKIAHSNLAEIDSARGNYQQALEHYKQYIIYRDSITNKENTKKMMQEQMQYEYEKKERDLKCLKDVSDAEAREAQQRYEQQLLLSRTREQELELKQSALELSEKERDLHQLAFQKKQAELGLVELEKADREKQLDLKVKENTLQEMRLDNRSLERNILLLGVILSFISIYLIFRNYANQRRANRNLQLLNAEVGEVNQQLNESNTELNNTLEDLKQTQAQLVATEKMKETEIIRRRISQDIHDDISSGLTRIAWLSETAREIAGNDGNGEVNATLTKIVSSSRETIERLGEIIWAINPDKDNLEGFFAYLRTYIMHYLEGTDYKVIIDFPEQKLDVRFNPDLKRTLFLVVKEALHNVVKHSGAQSIDISFHCIGQRYEIVIADDGHGFDPAMVNAHSNGLRNMKQRIEAVGGTFDVITGNGDGTKVMLAGEIYA